MIKCGILTNTPWDHFWRHILYSGDLYFSHWSFHSRIQPLQWPYHHERWDFGSKGSAVWSQQELAGKCGDYEDSIFKILIVWSVCDSNIEEECQRNPPQVQIQSGAHLTKNYSKINSDQTFHSNIYETFSHRLKQNHQISHLIEQMMHPAFHLTLIEQGAMHQWATAPQPLTPTPISASQIHTK